MQLREFAESKGFPVFALDSVHHRFDRGGTLSGWFKGETVTTPSGGRVQIVTMGDWQSGEKYEWRSTDGQTLSPEAQAEAAAALEQARLAGLERVAAAQKLAAQECFKAWSNGATTGTSAYLQKKLPQGGDLGKHTGGVKLSAVDPGVTLVPAVDTNGNLHGLQAISTMGEKLFHKGMRIKGCFSPVPWVINPQEILLCEGIATAISIHTATGKSVLSCFNAANLVNVAREARAKWPDASITICADNDAWTVGRDGKPWNPGLEFADKAMRVANAGCAIPKFVSPEKGKTDFNDLHVAEGAEAVSLQILPFIGDNQFEDSMPYGDPSPKPEATPEQPAGDPGPGADAEKAQESGEQPESTGPKLGAIKSAVYRASPEAKPKLPGQQHLADHLLRYFDGRMIKQDRDLFLYTGTHWKWMTLGDQDRIKQVMQAACEGKAELKLIEAAFKLFVIHLPKAPEAIDMFTPHPWAVNFKNGTLHLVRSLDHTFKTEFKPHQAQNYLINCLPFDYDPERKAKNPEFLSMLDRVFAGDGDISDKIRCVRQFYGACLTPAFPMLFMMYGGPGTGKSTVLNIAKRLVHKDNLCSVAPSELSGFSMESMAGKLVNIDTDIPLNAPIDDAIVKKIIERQPMRIRRKGIKDLVTTVPALHGFGGNGIPKTLDGASGAHTRRWVFLGFFKFVAQGQYDKEFWDWCFEQSPMGILNFALEGLDDLCANRGHFVQPESGAKRKREWQEPSELPGLFLAAIEEGDVSDKNNRVWLNPKSQIGRKQIWECFKNWTEENYPRCPLAPASVLYSVLRQRGFEEKKIHGVRYFGGISIEEPEGSDF